MKIEPNFDDFLLGGYQKKKDVQNKNPHLCRKNLDGDILYLEIDSIKEFYDAFMCSGYFENKNI